MNGWLPTFLVAIFCIIGIPLLLTPLISLLWRYALNQREDALLLAEAAQTNTLADTADWPPMATVYTGGEMPELRDPSKGGGNDSDGVDDVRLMDWAKIMPVSCRLTYPPGHSKTPALVTYESPFPVRGERQRRWLAEFRSRLESGLPASASSLELQRLDPLHESVAAHPDALRVTVLIRMPCSHVKARTHNDGRVERLPDMEFGVVDCSLSSLSGSSWRDGNGQAREAT
ncbi:hypothetical protein L226DRAFT_536822 [Lentinus tigrinus ALCF2SS1-7]|uniref:Uncharacterized protein n=1 Tax=Lentinus tigrinus ALCF2SS1-6 TaxID=1328759 RepID=A0A5C2S5C1_9APHY|nr:hypothetical protein L227DRAFT_577246 [Lentinus tigrinus ALCF2SS1-6]RPD72993.1 hypothetical protein L226DRAFT_536822 [Lentinus tigrinus ALCF2SS1-7]